ncbi:MAG: DUF3576 domain-containing protein [Alphaproteobacteria bacterium]|nr:DUF3576 domain-containing protein [Alphaproteobacteria bacterium]
MRLGLAKIVAPAMFAVLISALAACQYADPGENEVKNPKKSRGATANSSVFGDSGLQLFGRGDDDEVGGGAGIGVNSHLWRASLDTISFMPLSSADPFGGVIITDWYAPPDTPRERFKMTIYILARTLRADGLRVAVFRQQQSDQGAWVDSAINPSTVTSLENKILERARQLRTGGIGE